MAVSASGSNSSSLQARADGRSSADVAASVAERDAQRRINDAQNRVEEAERATAGRLDSIRDEYVRQYENQSARQEAALEAERNKGYSAIREVQRANQAEINRVRKQGDSDLQTIKNYYETTVYNTEHDGSQKLEDLRVKQGLLLDHETKSFDLDMQTNRNEQSRRLMTLQSEQDEAYDHLQKSSAENLEKQKDNTNRANEEAEQKYKQRVAELRARHDAEIHGLASRSNKELNRLRYETAQKLAAYEDRARDPFYKLVEIDADVEETADAYILRAYVPEHEQHHVSVNVTNDRITLSGQRRNEEKLELEPGHKVATASFQTYSESFPIQFPVDSRNVTRKFDGETLTVVVPKKGTYAPKPYKAKPAEKARLERPDFPEYLPLAKNKPAAPTPEETEAQEKQKRPIKDYGAGTLT